MIIIKDALKFFHAYIREIIDVGGENLPKAISTKSGAKLGKIYKSKGGIMSIETSLKQIYSVLGAKPIIKKLNEKTYEVIIKYPKKFCPIGGGPNRSRINLFQQSVCIPYTRGFLNELFPQFHFESDILNCIPLDHHKNCHYILKIEKKSNID
ncbi:MAG: hypothetical protein ACFE9Z_04915 [Promethearchaeota archaeon]